MSLYGRRHAPGIRRAFGHAMLASERPAPPWGATCRVCGKKCDAGEPVLYRAWGVDSACLACGWLRPDEREPHELKGGELRRIYFEWACTTCGRDVIAEKKPDGATDLRCPGCARAA